MYFRVQIKISVNSDSVYNINSIDFMIADKTWVLLFPSTLLLLLNEWHSKHIKISKVNLPKNVDEFDVQ